MAKKNKKKSKNNKKNKVNRGRVEKNKNKYNKDEETGLDAEEIEEDMDQNQHKMQIEDDSDVEDKPQKKKKKKPITADGTENKKGKKSIRQMKKEKHAERQAATAAAAKDELKSQCLSYLSQWKHNRQHWKFMKAKQVWLYKNKFSSSLIPDISWPILLEYFESAQGNIRNLLLEDASKVIKQMDEWTESQSKDDKTEEEEDGKDEAQTNRPDDTTYKRARDLLQCLQE